MRRWRSHHDFGKDLLPRLVARGEAVYGYRVSSYWQDVGTLDSYYQANLDLLSDRAPLDLNDPSWVIHTQSADRPPVRFESGASADSSLIANGCRIAGRVERSVLFPGVTVEHGATVRDSIIMNDTTVTWCSRRAIIDGAEVVRRRARRPRRSAHPNQRALTISSGLVVVGKGALPAGPVVGRNARIGAFVIERQLTADVPAGGVVHGPEPEH
jgi:glucose-1-phosphate adenylyltransferase